jgi:hypothetical protein
MTFISLALSLLVAAPKPNIIFVLTDDQDLLLGSMRRDGPMQNLIREVVDKVHHYEAHTAPRHSPIPHLALSLPLHRNAHTAPRATRLFLTSLSLSPSPPQRTPGRKLHERLCSHPNLLPIAGYDPNWNVHAQQWCPGQHLRR